MKVCFDSSFGKSIDKIKGNSILNKIDKALVAFIFSARSYFSQMSF